MHPTGKRQLFAEMLVTKIEGFITDMVGEEAKGYVPYLSTVLIYLAFANLIGLFGVKPPTKDLNGTAALAFPLQYLPTLQCLLQLLHP